ncbi:MAG: hypothetical protein U0X20_14605 [Caldilineaceae bacterium]
MARAIKIDEYLSDPSTLLDALSKIVKKLSQNRPSEIPAEKVVQYQEVSKTIERLREAGAEIPDELRRLKLDLAKYAEAHREASESCNQALLVLQDIEGHLNLTLADVRAAISKLSADDSPKGKTKRYVKRTSPTILARELRKAIRQLGGSAKKAEILQVMRENLEGKFKPQDLERDAQGNLNWEKWVVAEKNKMIKDGIIRTGSGFGVWELRRK